MQFTIRRDDLIHQLGRMAHVLPKRTTLPSLEFVRLEAGENLRLHIRATNLDSHIEITCEAEAVGAPGIGLAPGRLLLDALRQCAGRLVRFRLMEGLDQRPPALVVEAGRTRYVLKSFSTDEYPEPPDAILGGQARIEIATLREAARRVLSAVSTEDSRPILNAMLLRIEPGEVTCVGCSGHEMVELRAPTAYDGERDDLLVHPRAVRHIAQLHGQCGAIEVAWSESWVVTSSDRVRGTWRLIEGPYPDYRRVMRDREADVIVAQVRRGRLASALSRALVTTDDYNDRTLVDVTERGLTLRTLTKGKGESEEHVPAAVSGGTIRIGANARKLLRRLQVLQTDDVRLGFVAEERAITISDVPSNGMYQLLMPLRLLDD